MYVYTLYIYPVVEFETSPAAHICKSAGPADQGIYHNMDIFSIYFEIKVKVLVKTKDILRGRIDQALDPLVSLHLHLSESYGI